MDRSEEYPLEGQAYGITREELNTWSLWGRYFGGRIATLRFTLLQQLEDPPGKVKAIPWEVETRGRWVLGTVYDSDRVSVAQGQRDKKGIIRTTQVQEIDTGTGVHRYNPPLSWRRIIGGSLLAVGVLLLVLAVLLLLTANLGNVVLSGIGVIGLVSVVAGILLLRTPQRESKLVIRGTVQPRTVATRSEPAWWGQRTVSVLSFKLRRDRPERGKPEFAQVELRAPRLRGNVAESHTISAYGDVSEAGLVRAVHLVNEATGVTVGEHRPPLPWLHFIGVPLVVIGLNALLVSPIVLTLVMQGLASEAIVLVSVPLLGVVLCVAGALLIRRENQSDR